MASKTIVDALIVRSWLVNLNYKWNPYHASN